MEKIEQEYLLLILIHFCYDKFEYYIFMIENQGKIFRFNINDINKSI